MRAAYGPARQAITRAFSPLVYINRRDAAVRLVTNEAKVQALLQPLGFEPY
jgi:hypothetical protein